MRPSKWDIPLLNQPKQEGLLSTSLWGQEILKLYKKELHWQRLRKVWELRRSVNER